MIGFAQPVDGLLHPVEALADRFQCFADHLVNLFQVFPSQAHVVSSSVGDSGCEDTTRRSGSRIDV